MNNPKSSELMTGSAQIYIPPTKKFKFTHDGTCSITDQDGFQIGEGNTVISKSPGILNIMGDGLWAIEYQDFDKTFTPADDTPVEVGIESPPDIMTRMRQMIASEFMNKYGAQSTEVETLEEALDFDIDGDGNIGFSAAEIAAMDEEELKDMGLIKTPNPEKLEPAPVEPTTGETAKPPETPPPAV